MTKPTRASLAERALKRAIDEETAQVQVELRAALERVAQLEALLKKISQDALAGVAASPMAMVTVPFTAGLPKAALPPEALRALAAPAEPEPAPVLALPLAPQDDLGDDGRWV